MGLCGPNQGFGNAGKDAVVGPGRVNFTTSLYKSFAMTERAHFELRIESFNTFNHTQYNSLNTGGPADQNGSFGQVTNTWDPRTLEMGGKFVFRGSWNSTLIGGAAGPSGRALFFVIWDVVVLQQTWLTLPGAAPRKRLQIRRLL